MNRITFQGYTVRDLNNDLLVKLAAVPSGADGAEATLRETLITCDGAPWPPQGQTRATAPLSVPVGVAMRLLAEQDALASFPESELEAAFEAADMSFRGGTLRLGGHTYALRSPTISEYAERMRLAKNSSSLAILWLLRDCLQSIDGQPVQQAHLNWPCDVRVTRALMAFLLVIIGGDLGNGQAGGGVVVEVVDAPSP